MNGFIIVILSWFVGVPILCLIGMKISDIYWTLKEQ